MASLPNVNIVSHKAPRRVELHFQDSTLGVGAFQWQPLGALWVAGHLVAAALELLNERGRLGVTQDGFAHEVLWENWGKDEPSWVPSYLHTVQAVNREIARCRDEGIPYRLTIDLIKDPLEPAPPKEPTE